MHELRAQIRRHLVGAWRYRWLALAAAWGLCLAGWSASMLMPNVYEASARLYVDADAVLTPLLKGLALDNTLGSQLEMMQRTLLSRPNLETLIAKTDLDLSINGPADMEREVSRLASEIRLVSQTRNLFSIAYRSTRPRLAYDVVNTILNIFIETSAGTSRADLRNAGQFLEQQINEYEQQLHEAERRRADFRARYVDLLPADATGTTRLDDARANVVRLQGELADARDKHARLQQQLAKTPQTVVTETDPGTPGGVSGGDGELAGAESRLRDLLANDTEANPEVVQQQRLVAGLRRRGGGGGRVIPGRAARTRSVPNDVYGQLTLALLDTEELVASLQRRVADATQERDRLEQVARNAPGLQAQYVALNRDYDVIRRNYDELIARREAMRISAAADAEADKIKLQVIDPPLVPRVPVGPRRALMLTGVLGAGLAGGLGLAVLLSQLDRSFHSVRDLRSLGLPVAGAISRLASTAGRRRRAALGVAALGVGLLLLCGVYGGLMARLLRGAGAA